MFLHSCYKAVFKWMVWVSLPCASATYNHMEANQLLFVRGTFLTWLFFDTQYSCKKNYSKFFSLMQICWSSQKITINIGHFTRIY